MALIVVIANHANSTNRANLLGNRNSANADPRGLCGFSRIAPRGERVVSSSLSCQRFLVRTPLVAHGVIRVIRRIRQIRDANDQRFFVAQDLRRERLSIASRSNPRRSAKSVDIRVANEQLQTRKRTNYSATRLRGPLGRELRINVSSSSSRNLSQAGGIGICRRRALSLRNTSHPSLFSGATPGDPPRRSGTGLGSDRRSRSRRRSSSAACASQTSH